MSVHEPPQFTPAQVLDAARRAESEGRFDYAQQFYRHLVEKYPATGEAAMARTSLGRLAGDTGAGLPALGSPVMNSAPGMPPPPSFGMPRSEQEPPSLGNPFDTRPPEQAGWQPTYAQPYAQPQPVHYAAEHTTEPIELPAPRNGYLLGRVLARLVAWFGVIHLLLGLGLVPLSILNPRGIQALPALGPYLSSPTFGMTLLILGLVLVLLGQVARALLDHANAAKDMAAIMRAEAEARHGTPARQRRR